MKNIHTLMSMNPKLTLIARFTGGVLLMASLAACSGGGSTAEVPEAFVQTVANAHVMEGNSGSTQLEFVVTLNKAVVRGLDVTYSTQSAAMTANDIAAATAGTSCGVVGADYVTATNSKLTIPPGATTGKLLVTVCGDSVFESTESLKLAWTSAGVSGTAFGTIVNDDAGGLNGTGASTSMGGGAAFGRDTNPLTNSNADGTLGFSFEKQPSAASWNCSYDKVTGLTWQRPSGTTAAFANLATYVSSFNSAPTCGHTDWRVPNVNELLSLMDASVLGANAPNADRNGSIDAMTGRYWSSEVTPFSSLNAYVVDTSNAGAVSYGASSEFNAVRLVRGTANSDACDNADGRYRDVGDGTVVDSKTGLMWKKCVQGSSDAACASGTPLNFFSAVDVVQNLSLTNEGTSVLNLGYSDWRIPSRNELASLVKRSCIISNTRAAIVNTVFPATDRLSFVSSTFDANNSTQYWFVDFAEGGVFVSGFAGGKRLRLVRGGQ
jgi:hypothetical protein